jgi:hypothetical protein
LEMMINLQVPYKVRDILISWATTTF